MANIVLSNLLVNAVNSEYDDLKDLVENVFEVEDVDLNSR